MISIFKNISLVNKQRLIIALAVITAIVISYVVWTFIDDAHKEVKIQKAIQKATESKVEADFKKQQIKQAHTDFVAAQDKRVQKAISIRDNFKSTTKKAQDEKPQINDVDYNVMLDSLYIAQPD